MAKKKKLVDLKAKKIEFVLNDTLYKLESFNPNTMTLTLERLEADEKTFMRDFPFAHLPKEIKKIVKSN